MTKVGKRISIFGTGSSIGKSTLAMALSKKFDCPVVHLDQIYFLPNQNVWRPKEEYTQWHDVEIKKEKWIIEGNYSDTMPQRFENSDTIIFIDMSRFGSVWRYLKRHYAEVKYNIRQIGVNEAEKPILNWGTIWYLLQPKILYKRRRNATRKIKNLLKMHRSKVITIRSFSEMNRLIERVELID
jgi:adenylate kinase family enzyme